ncbi:MAG: hypothetical protein ACLQVD_22185 [Capsulimonadaceae bacterium]
MPNYYLKTDGSKLVFDSQIGSGGEGFVYGVVGNADLAVKIYHYPTIKRAEKLQALASYSPPGAEHSEGRFNVVWPVDQVYVKIGSRRKIVGLAMPRLYGRRSISYAYHPPLRIKYYPLFTYTHLHQTAINLTHLVNAVHEAGFVIADLNHTNIFVADTVCVSMVDVDSFQVIDPNSRKTLRTRVRKAHYVPPELQSAHKRGQLEEIDATEYHDRFALGVVIYRLLFHGCHPYHGTSLLEPISGGDFNHGIRNGVDLTDPAAPNLATLHPGLRLLIMRCFDAGHHDPAVRPSALEWKQALEAARDSLRECQANPQHYYDRSLSNCPWCARLEATGVDLFPLPAQRPAAREVGEPSKGRLSGTALLWATVILALLVMLSLIPTHHHPSNRRPRTEMMYRSRRVGSGIPSCDLMADAAIH